MKVYGLTKKIKFEYEGEEEEITMKSSVAVLGLYKSMFGSDMIKDVLEFLKGFNVQDLQKIKELDIEKEIEDYTAEELNVLLELVEQNTSSIDTSIMLQIMVALILNAVPEYKRPSLPDALDVVPPHFLTNKEAMQETINLIAPFINDRKK